MNATVTTPAAVTRRAIVIADDDAEVLGVLSLLLRNLRPVVEAADGLQALELVRKHMPALLVCDSEMPGLRARDVIQAMRQDPELASIPVIVTSGHPESEVLDRDMLPTAFLAKPFTMNELVQLVERTLAGAVS